MKFVWKVYGVFTLIIHLLYVGEIGNPHYLKQKRKVQNSNENEENVTENVKKCTSPWINIIILKY